MKKQPERTCMGCNEKKAKKEFIRIVKNKDNEINTFHWIYQKNQYCTWNGSNIRSEKRNDIRHANDHADQRYIRHP